MNTADRWIEHVVPLRWSDDRELVEFTSYLGSLRPFADITVVDGSPSHMFDRHADEWRLIARHLPVRPWPGRNGKVAGVVTGVRAARHESVIIADNDVRYRPEQLRQVAVRLAGADVVRPQNIFSPMPWHARRDTARSLVNRAFGSDYPGTLGVRRSTFNRAGGYDGPGGGRRARLRQDEAPSPSAGAAPPEHLRSATAPTSCGVGQIPDASGPPGRS